MISRSIGILVSTLLLLGLGLVVVKGVTTLDSRAVVTTQELVTAGASRVESDLQQQAREVASIAERFAGEQGFATDLKSLSAVLALAPAGSKVAEHLKPRIDALKAKLVEQTAILKEESPHLTAVTIVDEGGIVVSTDSTSFKVGDRLANPKEDLGDNAAGDTGAEGAEAPPKPTKAPAKSAPLSKGGFTLTAFDDEVQQATIQESGTVKWIGAGPIKLHGAIVGAVIMEAKLQTLARTAGAEAALILGDAVVLGKPPKGFELAAVKDTDQPYLLIERSPQAIVPGLGELPLGPMMVDRSTVGVWAHRFAMPGLTNVHGLVFADVSQLYGELAGFQVLVLLLLFGVWLGHVIIIAASGAMLRRGVDRIADFLGRLHQGIGDEKLLNEKSLPKALLRLALLINKTLERGASGVVTPLAKSPSLDEVLQVQKVEPAPEVGDFEFKGITDGGSLGVKGAAAPDADGYESMGEVAKAVEQQVDAETPAPHPEELPAAREAMAAVDHLGAATPEPRPAVTEPAAAPVPAAAKAPPATGAILSDADFELPPPPEAAPDAKGKGQPKLGDLLDEYATDATTVMQLSPQLMAAMRDASVAVEKKQQAADSVSSNVAAADAALAELESAVSPRPAATRPAAPAPAAVRPAPRPAAPTGVSFTDSQATSVMPVAVAKQMAAKLAAVEPPRAAVNPHYREVFEQFVATRKKCGEAVADLTFDKFVAKLDKSKEAVIAKHQCADVRFQVYVKDGKAALKALPAR